MPGDLQHIKNTGSLCFEKGYGDTLGFRDKDYLQMGSHISTRNEAFSRDIVCSLKVPEKDDYTFLRNGQTLFGWIHAAQNSEITGVLVKKKMTAIAWENMFKNDRHIFQKNNRLAGEAAVMQASLYIGKPLYECMAAVLGNGNAAKGATSVLKKLGARVKIYDIDTIGSLSKNLGDYDVIVNAVFWNIFNKHRIIYKSDIKRMKKGSLIIDVSCNNGLEIETSRSTSIRNPVYMVDGIIHYAVDHTPALFWKTASKAIGAEVKKYIDDLVEDNENDVIARATIIRKGVIIDQDIKKFQNIV